MVQRRLGRELSWLNNDMKLFEVQKHRSDLEARLLTDLDQWDGAGLPETDEPH
jgi:hypothetical protein